MSPSCSEPRRVHGRRAAALLLLLALPACAPLTIPQEQRLGREMSRELSSQLLFVRDEVVARYIADIGDQIIEAAGAQPFRYRFFVVEDPELNAFAAPAGYIYIHTGTILATRNASELVAVIAHEIGHVAWRHIAHNYNRRVNTGIAYQMGVLMGAAFGGGLGASIAQLGGALAGTAYLNQFGRDAEMQADAFAVDVLPRIGWDPRGLVTFFETLQQEDGANVPEFLSSHPATEDRIEAANTRIQKLVLDPSLRSDDAGKLEIIQRRIEIRTGASRKPPATQP